MTIHDDTRWQSHALLGVMLLLNSVWLPDASAPWWWAPLTLCMGAIWANNAMPGAGRRARARRERQIVYDVVRAVNAALAEHGGGVVGLSPWSSDLAAADAVLREVSARQSDGAR